VRTTIKLATTQNGQADVRIVSPGDSSNYIGRNQERHAFDTATDVGSSTNGLDPSFIGSHHTVHLPKSAETPVDFFKRAGVLHTVAGNSSAVFHVDGHPEYSWNYWGVLNTAAPSSAIDGGHVSVNQNFIPRGNIPYRVAAAGGVIINNNAASDPLTVHFKSRALYAVVIQGDDGVRNVSALASTMRMQCPMLEPHPSPHGGPSMFFNTPVAQTTQQLQEVLEHRIGEHARHHDRPQTTSSHTTEKEILEGTVGAGGGGYTAKKAFDRYADNKTKEQATDMWSRFEEGVAEQFKAAADWANSLPTRALDYLTEAGPSRAIGHFVG
jgi:hypothetical protein